MKDKIMTTNKLPLNQKAAALCGGMAAIGLSLAFALHAFEPEPESLCATITLTDTNELVVSEAVPC